MATEFIPFYQKIPVLGKYLVSNKVYELYTSQGFEKAFETMKKNHPRTAVGLAGGVGPDGNPVARFNKDAFDKVVTSKAKDFGVFAKVKGIDDEDLTTKLKSATDAVLVSRVKDQIKAMLAPTPEFEDAQKKYAKAIAYLEKNPQGRKAEALLGFIANTKDKAVDAIKKQHKAEKDALDAKFARTDLAAVPPVPNDGQLRADLKAGKPGGPGLNDDEVNAFKKNMVTELEKSQAKELAEFTKSIDQNITKLHKTEAFQNRERMFIYTLYMNNPKMKSLIEDNPKKRDIPISQRTIVSVNGSSQTIDFSGVKLSDLGVIKSKTGKDIKINKDGSFTMQFGDDPFFYNISHNQNAKSDLLLMAQAVKSGNDEITFEFDGFEDPELAMQRGREAYEACIEAGFKPEDIAIKVNGVLYTDTKEAIPKKDKDSHKKIREDLFSDHQNTYQTVTSSAPTFKQRYERLEKVEVNKSEPLMQEIQEEVNKFVPT